MMGNRQRPEARPAGAVQAGGKAAPEDGREKPMKLTGYYRRFGIALYQVDVEDGGHYTKLTSRRGTVVHLPAPTKIHDFLVAAYAADINPLPCLRRLVRRYNEDAGEWKFFHSPREAEQEVELRGVPAVTFQVTADFSPAVVVWWPWCHQKRDPGPPYINMV